MIITEARSEVLQNDEFPQAAVVARNVTTRMEGFLRRALRQLYDCTFKCPCCWGVWLKCSPVSFYRKLLLEMCLLVEGT